MKGVFDFLTLILLALGVLLLIMGVSNYKSRKEKFDVRYFRYAMGVSFLMSALLRIFTGGFPLWEVIAIIAIFIIANMLASIRSKKYT